MSKVLFRVDASKEIGLGHLMRCLLVADYLSDFNYEIYFLCNPFPGGDYSKVIKKGYSINEYAMTIKKTKERVDHIFKTEQDIFAFLGMDYKSPVER